MRTGGFITIHRKIEEWPLYKSMTGAQRHVITSLLLLANWKPNVTWWKGRRIDVGRGELLQGEREIAKYAGTSRSVVRTALKALELDGFLARGKAHEEHNAPFKITIRNYDRFQRVVDETEPEIEPRDAHEKGHEQAHGQAPLEPIEPINQTSWVAFEKALNQRLGVMRGWPADRQQRDAVEGHIARLGLGAVVDACVEAVAVSRKKKGNENRVPGVPYFLAVLGGILTPKTQSGQAADDIGAMVKVWRAQAKGVPVE